MMRNFFKFENYLVKDVETKMIMISISALKVRKLGLSSQGKLRFGRNISSLNDNFQL